MAAYNWIRVDARCPQCGDRAPIRAQCHVASSHDGDEAGRFFDADYAPGERLRWWPPEHPRYPSWRAGTPHDDPLRDRTVECCYASCLRCDARLYAVVEFESAAAVAVAAVGREQDWPDDHLK